MKTKKCRKILDKKECDANPKCYSKKKGKYKCNNKPVVAEVLKKSSVKSLSSRNSASSPTTSRFSSRNSASSPIPKSIDKTPDPVAEEHLDKIQVLPEVEPKDNPCLK